MRLIGNCAVLRYFFGDFVGGLFEGFVFAGEGRRGFGAAYAVAEASEPSHCARTVPDASVLWRKLSGLKMDMDG